MTVTPENVSVRMGSKEILVNAASFAQILAIIQMILAPVEIAVAASMKTLMGAIAMELVVAK